MPKVKLICTKSWGYNTRRLQANDSFYAKDRNDANILVNTLKVARFDYDAPVTEALPPPRSVTLDVPPAAPPPQPVYRAPSLPTSVAQPHEPDSLDSLRAEAEALGLHIDRRWGEARLLQEIDGARTRKAMQEAAASTATSATAMTTESASALLPYSHERDEE